MFISTCNVLGFFVINDNLYSGNARKLSCKGMLIAACSRMIKNLSSELARTHKKLDSLCPRSCKMEKCR